MVNKDEYNMHNNITYSPDIFPSPTISPPFLHGVAHSPLTPSPSPSANLQYKAIYCYREYKIDSAFRNIG